MMSRETSFPTARRVALSGALVFASVAWSWPGQAETAPPQARAHFRAGVGHLQSQDPDRYGRAYSEFKEAYAEFPSWKVLGNLGVAAQGLERYGEAIDAYEEHLEKGGTAVDAKEAAQVRRDLEQLRGEHARVTLEAARGPFWIVDTRLAATGPIVNQYGPFDARVELRVRPGEHEFRLDDARDTAAVWKVHLLPGDASAHIFDLKIAPEPSAENVPKGTPATASEHGADRDVGTGRSHVPSYLLWGVGAAGAVTATVFFLEARQLQRDANRDFARNCPNGVVDSDPRCTRTTAGDAKAANWRTGALLTGIGAGAALIAGTTLYLWGDEGTDTTGNSEGAARSSLRAWVDVGGVGIGGTF